MEGRTLRISAVQPLKASSSSLSLQLVAVENQVEDPNTTKVPCIKVPYGRGNGEQGREKATRHVEARARVLRTS